MADGKATEPHDLILDHLRAIRLDLAALKMGQEQLKSDVLNVRKDIHALRGDLLRIEESGAATAAEVERINIRLGLNDTPQ